MRRPLRILAVCVSIAGAVTAVSATVGPLAVTAHASVTGGDGSGGTVTVGASGGSSGGGAPGGSGGGGATGGSGSPWTCTYEALALNDAAGPPPGAATPGGWYSVTCTDSETGATTTQTEWIADQTPTGAPSVNPYDVALQAENSIRLPAPTPYFNPSGTTVVNLSTWLWIGAGIWHADSVSASVGSVSATAVAVPVSVTWRMGDGSVVVCDGPGTPFDPAAALPATTCSHTYAESSAGQPSPDGNPNDGSFVVTVSVTWSVSWSARGAAGGGDLPSLVTATTTRLRVEQIESIDTDAFRTARIPTHGGSWS